MLNEKRIRETESNVREYLREGLLKKIYNQDYRIIKILLKNSEESIKVAKASLDTLSSPL